MCLLLGLEISQQQGFVPSVEEDDLVALVPQEVNLEIPLRLVLSLPSFCSYFCFSMLCEQGTWVKEQLPEQELPVLLVPSLIPSVMEEVLVLSFQVKMMVEALLPS